MNKGSGSPVSAYNERVCTRPVGPIVRLLAWLLRPVIWEAMRQHPVVDVHRDESSHLMTLRDVLDRDSYIQ